MSRWMGVSLCLQKFKNMDSNGKKWLVLKDFVIVNNQLVRQGTILPKDVMEESGGKESQHEDFVTVKNQLVREGTIQPKDVMEESGGKESQHEDMENTEGSASCALDETSTLLLLDEYEKRIQDFRNPKMKKRLIWEEIAERFRNMGYSNITSSYLDQKLRNMRNTYKKIKDNNKATGRGRINWRYYERFENIFATDKTINMPPLISTTIPPNDIATSSVSSAQVMCSSSSSRGSGCSDISQVKKKSRLDTLRKRQIELDEQRIEEMKQMRLQLEESNRINSRKVMLLEKYLQLKEQP